MVMLNNHRVNILLASHLPSTFSHPFHRCLDGQAQSSRICMLVLPQGSVMAQKVPKKWQFDPPKNGDVMMR